MDVDVVVAEHLRHPARYRLAAAPETRPALARKGNLRCAKQVSPCSVALDSK